MGPLRPGHRAPERAFDAAQGAVAAALDGLFAAGGRELGGVPEHAREGKVLRSVVNPREGLSVFAGRARVPLDKQSCRAAAPGPAIGGRLCSAPTAEAAGGSRR